MKHAHRTMMGLGLAALAPFAAAQDTPAAPAPAPAPAATPAPVELTPAEVKEVFSYFFGQDFGGQVGRGAPLTIDDFDKDALFRGIADALSAKVDPELTEEKLEAVLNSFQKTLEERAAAQDKADAPAPAAPTAEVKSIFSYYIGQVFGQGLGDTTPITIDDFDKDAFFRGLTDSLGGKVDSRYSEQMLASAMDSFLQTLQGRTAAEGAANLAAGQKFLEENGKKEGVVTTPSGLQYKVIRESRGMRFDQKKHGSNAICDVIYEGRLIDGTVFDSCTEPRQFPISGVIPGFTEALKLMPVGSTYEIYIPANLAYGEQAPRVIGSNQTLIFKLTLTDIKPGMGTAEHPIELTPEVLEQLQQQGLQPAEGK